MKHLICEYSTIIGQSSEDSKDLIEDKLVISAAVFSFLFCAVLLAPAVVNIDTIV